MLESFRRVFKKGRVIFLKYVLRFVKILEKYILVGTVPPHYGRPQGKARVGACPPPHQLVEKIFI